MARPRSADYDRGVRILVLVAIVACGGGGDAPVEPAPAPVVAATSPPRPATLAHVTIKALGMTCPETCPLRVRGALAGIASVYELGFDLDHESVFVSYDASLGAAKDVTRPMLAAIRSAGYDPWLAKESWPADAQVQLVARQ